MKIIKCPKTGNILKIMSEREVLDEGVLTPYSTETGFEKHVPEIKINGNSATISLLNHPMDKEHYIEWILVDYGDLEIIKHFRPFEAPTITLNYSKNMKVYAYCNIHGLWINENENK